MDYIKIFKLSNFNEAFSDLVKETNYNRKIVSDFIDIFGENIFFCVKYSKGTVEWGSIACYKLVKGDEKEDTPTEYIAHYCKYLPISHFFSNTRFDKIERLPLLPKNYWYLRFLIIYGHAEPIYLGKYNECIEEMFCKMEDECL